MKKQISDVSLEAVLCAAKLAGQDAAQNAVNAGRVVAGWVDGRLVEYSPGDLPHSQQQREDGASNFVDE